MTHPALTRKKSRDLFTTIRLHNPDKEVYNRNLEDAQVEIVYTGN